MNQLMNTWFDWFKRTIFVGGILFWAFFCLLQMGVDCQINLPVVQHGKK